MKNPCWNMTSAPRKPIPVMMPCAIRLGLVLKLESRRNAQSRRLVGWHQHQKRGSETDEGMRPDARGSAMEASFKAKQASGGECAYQTDRNVDAGVRQRGPSTARSDQPRMLAYACCSVI